MHQTVSVSLYEATVDKMWLALTNEVFALVKQFSQSFPSKLSPSICNEPEADISAVYLLAYIHQPLGSKYKLPAYECDN